MWLFSVVNVAAFTIPMDEKLRSSLPDDVDEAHLLEHFRWGYLGVVEGKTGSIVAKTASVVTAVVSIC